MGFGLLEGFEGLGPTLSAQNLKPTFCRLPRNYIRVFSSNGLQKVGLGLLRSGLGVENFRA